MTRISASRALKEWAAGEWLTDPKKRGLGAVYTPGSRLLNQPRMASNNPEADAMESEGDAIPPQLSKNRPAIRRAAWLVCLGFYCRAACSTSRNARANRSGRSVPCGLNAPA